MTERAKKPLLLVINDNEIGRHLIVRMLAPYFELLEAATGAAGIERSLEKPDLILLDVNLPDMNGFEVCRSIKANHLTGHTPVLHLSATTLDAASRATGLENGADGYLTLPVETEVLVATINSLLRIKKTEADLAAANARLATLSRIDNIFLSTSGERTWKVLLAAVLELFSSPAGSLGYLNEEGEMVCGAVAGAVGGQDGANDPARASCPEWKEGLRAGALGGGDVLVSNGPSCLALPPGHPRLERFLSMPLMDGGRMVGHLTLANKAGDYTDGDISFAKFLRGHIAALLRGRVETERQEQRNRQMLVEMANMQKIESLGQLAGGIAHDFNNILAGIIGNLSVLGAKSSLSGEDAATIKDVLAASANAQKITAQLLTFAKEGQPVKRVFNFSEALTAWCGFALRGSNSKAELRLAPGLRPVNGDEGKLNQAVNNLLRNAVEAMPKGGTVKVEAENLEHAGGPDPALPPGEYVRLTVADTGTGIPAQNLARIFEPYFSTKTRGHGLGLSMAYSIIKSHGGELKVRSRLGAGSEFTVYLPAETAGAPAGREAPAAARKGSGRILVMDDDEIVLKAVRRMLAALGYDCVCAADGEEALRLYREAAEGSEPFRAVIMDLTIPGGMGGAEAVKKLLEFDPQARVAVSSGYSDDIVMAECAAAGFSAALTKPYQYEDLAEVLAKLTMQPDTVV